MKDAADDRSAEQRRDGRKRAGRVERLLAMRSERHVAGDDQTGDRPECDQGRLGSSTAPKESEPIAAIATPGTAFRRRRAAGERRPAANGRRRPEAACALAATIAAPTTGRPMTRYHCGADPTEGVGQVGPQPVLDLVDDGEEGGRDDRRRNAERRRRTGPAEGTTTAPAWREVREWVSPEGVVGQSAVTCAHIMAGTLLGFSATRGSYGRRRAARRTRLGACAPRRTSGDRCCYSRASRPGRRSTGRATAPSCAQPAPRPEQRSAKSSVAACDAGSCGRPAALPSGRSEKTNRGTPTCSTMSLAQPSTTVAMPCSSSARAARLTAGGRRDSWRPGWRRPRRPSWQRATSSGQSTSRVVRWLRLVGRPWKRGQPSRSARRSRAPELGQRESSGRGRRRSCGRGRSRGARSAGHGSGSRPRIDVVELRGRVVGRTGPWSPFSGSYGAAVVTSATRHSASGRGAAGRAPVELRPHVRRAVAERLVVGPDPLQVRDRRVVHHASDWHAAQRPVIGKCVNDAANPNWPAMAERI